MSYFLLLILIGLLFGWRIFRKASNDRNWKPDLQRIAHGRIDGDIVTLSNVRNNRYPEPGQPYDVVWTERSYDLSQIKRLWFIVEPFHPTIDAIAHTFLSFEFEDDYLCLSIEARSAVGQSYSIAKGLFGAFELSYLYGDEQDFILRRSHYMQHNLYLYPLITPPHEIKTLFLSMLDTANKLIDNPQFYNSITDNCTSRLREHANRVRPGSFPPFIWAQVLPGISDKVLHDKNWIDTPLAFEDIRDHYNISPKANAIGASPNFSKQIRAGLVIADKQARLEQAALAKT